LLCDRDRHPDPDRCPDPDFYLTPYHDRDRDLGPDLDPEVTRRLQLQVGGGGRAHPPSSHSDP
jgi:hypothetical protein